jgi:hypothetical protein
MTKNKSKKKRSKKAKKKSKKAIAKQQKELKEAQLNTEINQQKDLTFFQKIWQYKKLFSFGVISFFVLLYIQYYPDKLEISSENLNKRDLVTNVLIFKNPNSYDIQNVKVIMMGTTSQYIDTGGDKLSYLDHIGFKYSERLDKIPSKSSSHIDPNIASIGKTKYIVEYFFDVIYSFETPFIYPDVQHIQQFHGYMNDEKDIIYIEK